MDGIMQKKITFRIFLILTVENTENLDYNLPPTMKIWNADTWIQNSDRYKGFLLAVARRTWWLLQAWTQGSCCRAPSTAYLWNEHTCRNLKWVTHLRDIDHSCLQLAGSHHNSSSQFCFLFSPLSVFVVDFFFL